MHLKMLSAKRRPFRAGKDPNVVGTHWKQSRHDTNFVIIGIIGGLPLWQPTVPSMKTKLAS